MKPFSIFLFSLVFSLTCYSQNKRANNWYFGYKAGISFNTEPPTVLTDGVITTGEGCSTISDENGNLLFYTDGITIWNKQHQIMTNGTGLKGDPSSTESGVIVPYPEHPNLYYVFTVAELTGSDGFCYSIVDMNLNSGLGDVITKNVQLFTPSSEKITAVQHQNKQDIWVIAHHFKENLFYTYLITKTGININPVKSQTEMTYNITDVFAGNGYLKSSSNGKIIAMAIQKANLCGIFNFNNQTGQISKSIILENNENCYGIEFSPDNSKLYFTCNLKVFQFDLNASNAAPLQIGTRTGTFARSALQLASNGKIYVANYNGNLDVINNPNTVGTACNYGYGIDLGGKSKEGLPTYVQSYFATTTTEITFLNTCLGLPTLFSITTTNILSILWNFGDSTTSSEINPSHTYTNSATYNVQVTVNYQDNTSQTLSKSITIEPKPSKLSIIHN